MKRSQISWYFRWGVDTLRYEGLHILLWRMLELGLSPLGELRLKSFCRKDLTQPLDEAQAKVKLVVSQATEADIEQLAILVEKRDGPGRIREEAKTWSIQEAIRGRFQQGHKCFVAKIGSELVHYNWIFFHEVHFGHSTIYMSDREALCDDGFTIEEWRGKGVHGAVNGQMLLFLQRSGFRTAYTLLSTDNVSSKKALQRLGWDFFGILLHFNPRRSDRVLSWEVRGPLEPFVVKGT